MSNQSHPGRLPEGVSHQESVGLQLVSLKNQSSLCQAPRAVLEAALQSPGSACARRMACTIGMVCPCAAANTPVCFHQSRSRCV